METIEVGIHIDAPIEKVWERFTDIDAFTDLKEVSYAKLLKEGREARMGVGAVRELRLQGIKFVEDIVTFEPPSCLEYRVKKSTMPIRHDIGRMEFTPSDKGTDIHWTSRFEFPVPLIGKRLEPLLCRRMNKTFTSCLEQAKERLEAESQ